MLGKHPPIELRPSPHPAPEISDDAGTQPPHMQSTYPEPSAGTGPNPGLSPLHGALPQLRSAKEDRPL